MSTSNDLSWQVICGAFGLLGDKPAEQWEVPELAKKLALHLADRASPAGPKEFGGPSRRRDCHSAARPLCLC